MEGSVTKGLVDQASLSPGDSAASPTREVDPLTVTRRLQREGRWPEIEPLRNEMMKECRAKGMSKADAQAWTYSELDRLYPPLPSPQECPTAGYSYGDGDGSGGPVRGLAAIPKDWSDLPENASLPTEIGWVQANRLRVVEERSSGATIVHLDRARTPAPSWAALGWLETSIRSYAKYIDVAAKATSQQQGEQELVRRERMAIEEMREMLAEMMPTGAE